MTHSEHRAAVANLLLELPEDAVLSSTSGQPFVTLPRTNQTFALYELPGVCHIGTLGKLEV